MEFTGFKDVNGEKIFSNSKLYHLPSDNKVRVLKEDGIWYAKLLVETSSSKKEKLEKVYKETEIIEKIELMNEDVKNYIFGVLNSIKFVLKNEDEEIIAKDLRKHLLGDYKKETLIKVVKSIDEDFVLDFDKI